MGPTPDLVAILAAMCMPLPEWCPSWDWLCEPVSLPRLVPHPARPKAARRPRKARRR